MLHVVEDLTEWRPASGDVYYASLAGSYISRIDAETGHVMADCNPTFGIVGDLRRVSYFPKGTFRQSGNFQPVSRTRLICWTGSP